MSETKEICFEAIEVESDDKLVMVELDYIGEGSSGDYAPDDPTDEPLLRYTLYRKYQDGIELDKLKGLCDLDAYVDGDWMGIVDGSYCTQLPATADRELLTKLARYILSQVEPGLRDLERQKRLWESLSWIDIKHPVGGLS